MFMCPQLFLIFRTSQKPKKLKRSKTIQYLQIQTFTETLDLKCAESFHQSFEIEAKVFCFFLTKNGANFVTEMFCLEKAANINTNFFQNRLKLVENLLMPDIANDNFQAPTEMEVDFNQQNYGNPNEIRQPEGIGIKN